MLGTQPEHFLNILNQITAIHRESPENGLRSTFFKLINLTISGEHIYPSLEKTVNDTLDKHLQLRLSWATSKEVKQLNLFQDAPNSKSIWDSNLRFSFNTDLADHESIYMQGIVSLLDICQEGHFKLKRCHLCTKFFIPTKHEHRSRFCDAKCRNRYHYLNNTGATFTCTSCKEERKLDQFTGLAVIDDSITLETSVYKDDHALCITCADKDFPKWREHVDKPVFPEIVGFLPE